jgi:hypothetical protein
MLTGWLSAFQLMDSLVAVQVSGWDCLWGWGKGKGNDRAGFCGIPSFQNREG